MFLALAQGQQKAKLLEPETVQSSPWIFVQFSGFPEIGLPHSWMVYNGKSYLNLDDLGVPLQMVEIHGKWCIELLYKDFESKDRMEGKETDMKSSHILCLFAFQVNCRIGKTHILCVARTLYIDK